MSETLDNLVRYYETLTRESVHDLPRYYTQDAFFKDPFNEVRGLDKIIPIFEHMYDQVLEPRFIITERVSAENGVFLVWDFEFRMRRFKPQQKQTIRGVTHLRFAQDGRVNYHRDYWDAAEELYEKLPLVGSLMRWFKKQAG
ncbi:MAG: nuclear transport factor 2 family protein [Burkholderiales bacterium]